MSHEAVHKVAQGRIWTGQQALGHGLVDQLGGLHDTISLAKQLAGLPTVRTVLYTTAFIATTQLLSRRCTWQNRKEKNSLWR